MSTSRPTIAYVHPSGPMGSAPPVAGARPLPGVGGVETVLSHLFQHYTNAGIHVVSYHRLTDHNITTREQMTFGRVDIVRTYAVSVQWTDISVSTRGETETTRLIAETLQREFEESQPDIVHVHNLHERYLAPMAEGARLAAKAAGAATVHTAHNIWPLLSADPTYFPQDYDANLFSSPATYAAYLQRGASLSNAKVLTIGVDLNIFNPTGTRRADVDCQPDGLRLFLPGRADQAKGAEDAIEALGLLRINRPHLALNLTLCDALAPPGVAPKVDAHRQHLRHLAHVNGVTDRVFMLQTPYEQMPATMRSADLVLVPSRVQEGGYPQTLTEAIASGKPVITTIGGGQEQALRLAYGLQADHALVRPSDPQSLASAILFIAEREGIRTSLSVIGRESAEKHFDIRDTLRAHDKCYTQLVPQLL